jgi:SagB-type dehydrogenase family enzyme
MIHWNQHGQLLITDCNTFRQFRVSEPVLALLNRLSQPATLEDLAARFTRYPRVLMERLLSQLCSTGMVFCDEQVEQQLPSHWTLFELAMQRHTSLGGMRQPPLDSPAPPAFKHFGDREAIPLPRTEHAHSRSLRWVLNERKTVRTYSEQPLSLDELARFLYSSARVRQVIGPPENQRSRRPYPSGGARHPLELYLLCHRISDLTRGTYYYHPLAHALYLLKEPDERYQTIFDLVKAGAGGLLNRDPCVVILITAVFKRMMWKYERLSLATIYRDVGCLYQTMYLVATDMALAPCAIAGIQDVENAQWLGLDPLEEAQVGCFILGKR